MASGIPISTDTREALRAAVGASGSARRWALAHGVSPAVVSDILAGHDEDVSVRAENRVRAALGLPLVPPHLPAACCPDCLARGIEVVHGDGLRCHGKNGVAVVVGEDEEVVKRRRKRFLCRRRKEYLRLSVGEIGDPDARSWWRTASPAERARAIERAFQNGIDNR